jgi:trans-2-enoyl-CoA reductase
LNTYVIIDEKSITQNNILSINRLFYDEITHIDEYAGDYTFVGKNKKIRLKKMSFTPDDHDIIKELAERLNAAK